MSTLKNLIATIAITLSLNSLAQKIVDSKNTNDASENIKVKNQNEIDAKAPVCQGDGDIGGDPEDRK